MGATGVKLEHLGIIAAWIGALCYSLQIYFDFSGYSDMAIGMGAIFGFQIPENFDHPYASNSIREFWRRWHISLSSFFRDYLYIPLGGNRKHLYRNLVIVFILTGLWHGANWTFVLWGLWHGLFSIIERIVDGKMKLPVMIGRIYMMLVVVIGWVFFRMDSINEAVKYLSVMFGITKQIPAYNPGYYLNVFTGGVFLCGVIGAIPGPLARIFVVRSTITVPQKVIALILIIVSGMFLQASSYNPFLYFQF